MVTVLEDFEDGTVDDWTDNDGDMTVDSSDPIYGAYSGYIENNGDVNKEARIQPPTPFSSDVWFSVKITPPNFRSTATNPGLAVTLVQSSDFARLTTIYLNTNTGYIQVDDDDLYEFNEGTVYDFHIIPDFESATYDVEINGVLEVQDKSFQSADSTSTIDTLEFAVDTAGDDKGANGWIDDIKYAAPPAFPTSLSAASASDSAIDLSWDAADGTDDYHIYRAQASGSTLSDYTQIDSVAASQTTYTDTGLLNGEQYYYRVTASNPDGESDLSGEAAATTSLPAPSNVSLSITTPTDGTVSWTDESDNESEFRAVVFEDGDWAAGYDPSAGSESQPVSFSESADELQVRVRAETGHTTSDWTYSETASTTVTGLSVDGTRETEVDLSWDGTDQEDNYAVFRSETSGSGEADYTQVASPTGTTYTDTGLENGERYYYRVAAVYGGETDTLSSEVATTTELPAASGLSLDTAIEDEIALSWTRNDNSSDGSWEIYRSTDGSLGTEITGGLSPDTTSFTDTGLLDGERYYYTVRRVTGHASTDGPQANAITVLPAPTEFTVSNVTDTTADYAWTATHDHGETRVEYRPTTPNGEPDEDWQEHETVSRDTETVTVDGLRNGEQYEGRVVAVTDHTATEDE
ncbi:fibronectin type III domain-containing protein [Halorussus halobius]|uniref:fibronectin type III domain-containing protein n=1 Tax=Halorussus halobius TaxID=1710537 RepID=UPI001091EE59|nr:fibronectin type III domain-containing protein [Halorussus halobius]